MLRFFLSLILVIAITSCSKIDPRKLQIVNIYGQWCKTCNITDPVFQKLQHKYRKDKNLQFLVFDETDEVSLGRTEKIARENGLEALYEHERHTGEVLFVDTETKNVLARFYGVDDLKKYTKAISDLRAGKEIESIEAQYKSYDLSKPEAKDVHQADLLVVDIHHDLCGGCAVTAPIFEEVAKDFVNNRKVCFMTFDLTTNETVDQTRQLAAKTGLEEIYNTHKHTGEVLFINNKTKEIVGNLLLEKDKEKYYDLINELT